MNRRVFLKNCLTCAAALSLPVRVLRAEERFEVTKSDEEWKKILSSEAYRDLAKHGTEPAYSSPLEKEHRAGIFSCAGCDLPLYASETKFESHTGWPSFYQPLENAVRTSTDYD